MFAFSTVIYGNGDQTEDIVHKLKFVPLDMASKCPEDTNF